MAADVTSNFRIGNNRLLQGDAECTTMVWRRSELSMDDLPSSPSSISPPGSAPSPMSSSPPGSSPSAISSSPSTVSSIVAGSAPSPLGLHH
ncbi:hypothetical protein PENTCL1PPCAC_2627 [Pristionchus entomophagus]|uniref:Uncharacterized protein n=1 Tax=Pristionchus entomophagus TaxID=358040 RepID=A0AAV5SCM1_9BILA|nr:hypothetical protein PENTCL1PPCAC_2627 [Pristionchus entomophagus]